MKLKEKKKSTEQNWCLILNHPEAAGIKIYCPMVI